jgi:hypothetical protein
MPNPAGSGLPNEATYRETEETVIDQITCLEWQKVPLEQRDDWLSAIDYCEGLTLGGSNDWRLPSRIELLSITKFLEPAGVDEHVFVGTHAPTDWTASAEAGVIIDEDQPGAGFSWCRSADPGGVFPGAQSSKYGVRCVRGGGAGEAPSELAIAPANQYTQTAAGEIRDNYTGLTWEQDQSDASMPYEDAAAYCSSLALGGIAWRVPTAQELLTLVDEARRLGAIDLDVFPSTEYDAVDERVYWTAEPSSDGVTLERPGVNFATGALSFEDATEKQGWVKCVR